MVFVSSSVRFEPKSQTDPTGLYAWLQAIRPKQGDSILVADPERPYDGWRLACRYRLRNRSSQ